MELVSKLVDKKVLEFAWDKKSCVEQPTYGSKLCGENHLQKGGIRHDSWEDKDKKWSLVARGKHES